MASFDASYPGTSKQEICAADLKRARWSKMLNTAIEPPRKYAGLDMAKDDTWQGLTVEEAEKAPDPVTLEGGNCQPNVLGYSAGDTGEDVSSYWGDNQEVVFNYHIDTHIVDQMILNLGYLGGFTFHSRDGKSTYTMLIGNVWTKDSGAGPKPFPINWEGSATTYSAEITELFNAAMFTYGRFAGVANFQDSKDCGADKGCLVLPDDGNGTAIFGFRPLAIYFGAHNFQPQPAPSIPYYVYNFFIKNEPYGNANQVLKLDAEGATANGANLNPALPNCTLKVGLLWKDFLANCVNISGDAAIDQQNVNRLLGGRTHDFENFSFNVVGVNQNFTSTRLTGRGADPTKPAKEWFDVLQDDDVPEDADVATDWIFDVRARGKPQNDLDSNGTLDLHGTGLVMREWQRLVMADAAKLTGYTHIPGDPGCVAVDKNGNATGVVPYPPAPGCTGFEALVIPGPSYLGDPPGLIAMLDSAGFYGASYLAPGDPRSAFNFDPGFYTNYNYAAFWENALHTVIQVLGQQDVYRLPIEMRDRRYYFRWYAVAMIKYLKAYGLKGDAITPTDVANQPYDADSLFFDSNGGAAFDTFEYVEREFINQSPRHIPFDYTYGADVRVANQRFTNWYQRMDREETAMYEALATNKSAPPGSENNVNLTNLFGSPVLANNWESYECATTTTCANSAPLPPMRENPAKPGGVEPMLSLYPGAWGATIFHKGDSPIKIDQERPYIGGANVQLPSFANPYDKSTASTMLPVLVPWVPKIPGEGFLIPVTGTRDQLIETATLDFTGVLENYLVDYDYATKDGQTLSNIHIDAIEATDFLGEVFLCYAAGDILNVGMYTSAATIVDWIANHPGSQNSCDIVIRYSPYNNYVDYITSRANGVKVSISQGSGFGRVVDAILYDPTLAGQ